MHPWGVTAEKNIKDKGNKASRTIYYRVAMAEISERWIPRYGNDQGNKK